MNNCRHQLRTKSQRKPGPALEEKNVQPPHLGLPWQEILKTSFLVFKKKRWEKHSLLTTFVFIRSCNYDARTSRMGRAGGVPAMSTMRMGRLAVAMVWRVGSMARAREGVARKLGLLVGVGLAGDAR